VTLKQLIVKRAELKLESDMNRKTAEIKARMLLRSTAPYLQILSAGARAARVLGAGKRVISGIRTSREKLSRSRPDEIRTPDTCK
jgi:hypothetical protein